MKARPEPLNNFAGGGQISNDEYASENSKNVDFDCIMNAFFGERNKMGIHQLRYVTLRLPLTKVIRQGQ